MKCLIPILVFTTLSFSLYAQTRISAGEKVFEMAQNLKTLKSCDLEKIWPNYHWKNKFNSVLFVSSEDSKSYELDYGALVMNEIPFESTPPFALGGFSMSSIGNKKYISYSLDYGDTSQELLALLVHENFHFYGQDEIKEVPENIRATRADIYPFNPVPRIYRSMINFHLSEALRKPEEKMNQIGKAKFWNDLHRNEFFNDYISVGNLDITEGSAMYAEVLTLAMSQNNCELSKATIRSMLFQTEDSIYDFYTFYESDKAGQAYLGGMLAYLVDDLLFDGALQLKQKTLQGKQPMNELFIPFDSIESLVNEEIKQSINDDYRAMNEEARSAVDQYQENKHKGMIAISQPSPLEGDAGGSFSVSGFIAVDEDRYGFAEVYSDYRRKVQTPTISAHFDGVHFYQTTINECGKNQLVYWVEDIQINGSMLKASGNKVELTSTRFEQKTELICVK